MSELVNVSFTDTSGKVSARLENVVNTRMDYAAKLLEKKIKNKFKRSARFKSSSPGQFPKRINGHAMNSIRVFLTKETRRNVIRVGFKSKAKEYSKRIDMLSEKRKIKSKGKMLTIPVSWEAKKFASNKTGAMTVRDFKPGGQEMEVIPTKRGTFLGVRSGIGGRLIGRKFKKHFLLWRKPVTREARKGMSDAMREEEKWFVEYLTKGIESQFGAP